MRQALITSLERHPLFRSVAVKYDKETWLHVVIRSGQIWSNQAISTTNEAVAEAELLTYRLNDPDFDHADKSGLLFKATILPVKDNRSSAVVINMNHSM